MAIFLLLPVLAYQLTGSGLWTALVLVAGYLPHLAGTAADDAVTGWPDRRRLLLAVDLANAALLASVPIAFSLDALTAPHVLLAAFGTQALFVVFDAADLADAAGRHAQPHDGPHAQPAGSHAQPAAGQSPNGPHASPSGPHAQQPGGPHAPLPAGRDRLGRPLFIGDPAQLSAPLAGAGLLLLTAVPPLLTVDGVSIVVSALLIRAVVIRSHAVTEPPLPHSLGVGLRRRLAALWGRRTDQVHLVVCGMHAAAGGAFLGQFTPWLDQALDVRPVRDVRLGLLLAVWAAGGWLATAVLPRAAARLASNSGLLRPSAANRLVATGVLPRAAADRLVAGGLLGRLIDDLGGYRITLIFLPISALCLLCCAVAPHWTLAAVMLLAWGTAYLVVVLDARVAAGGLRMLAFGLGWPAGALLAGLVTAGGGPRLGLASGVLLIAVAAAVAWLSPLRTADRTAAAAEPG
jgi:hypothetical protein